MAFRCSHLCLSRLFFFLVKMMQIYFRKPIFRGRSSLLKSRNVFNATLTDVWWVLHIVFFRGISMELMISLEDLCIKWITGIGEKNVQVEYASEGAKTAFTKHRWAPCQIKKKKNLFFTLTKFGLMRSSKITVVQIGDLQNMLYFPGASHISPMETFTLAD